MADIETREESNALQAAYDAWVSSEIVGEKSAIPTPESERWALRAGWLAGREWERRRAAIGPSRPFDPSAVRAVASGLRLLGCQHAVSCRSVAQCDSLLSAR